MSHPREHRFVRQFQAVRRISLYHLLSRHKARDSATTLILWGMDSALGYGPLRAHLSAATSCAVRKREERRPCVNKA